MVLHECGKLIADTHTGAMADKYGIRKLTPLECIKFQGFPDNFNFPKSMANSHCYKQAGNSVVVPLIQIVSEQIFKVLK